MVAGGIAVNVPALVAHRIQNTGSEPLVFIEVQHGTYFGEDDIERIDDDYGRAVELTPQELPLRLQSIEHSGRVVLPAPRTPGPVVIARRGRSGDRAHC